MLGRIDVARAKQDREYGHQHGDGESDVAGDKAWPDWRREGIPADQRLK